MKPLVKGDIIDFVPFFNACIDNEILVLDENGNFPITVDTGFSGGIA